MIKTWECAVGDKSLIIETGKLAQQANGAVTVRYGDTVVLVTACSTGRPREGMDFFPLTVDYEERLYAAGKIPGGFIRREGRPSQEATLVSRLTDRLIRPLFPKGYRNEVQIVVTVLSTDRENEPDVLAAVGASAALTISDIPFEGPVGVVHIGYLDNRFVINPTFAQLTESSLDLVMAGTREAVVMVEAGAREVPEDLVMEAIRMGQQVNQNIIRLQQQIQAEVGKGKGEAVSKLPGSEVEAAVASLVKDRFALSFSQSDKAQREAEMEKLREEVLEKLCDTYPPEDILSVFDFQFKAGVRASILNRGTRLDGRGYSELRPVSCEVGLLPRTHGSGLFARGQTQVLTITTIGSPGEEQKLDGISQEEKKRFMHHYNFPPFSTGEVKRIGTPGRREIGHGALVEKALLPVIPSETEFPYTLRLVSEVVSSAGSTSMASVCASTLSLMDAGVPIKAPVAGISMGMVSNTDGKHVLLTDIEGLEDAYGDMDFKIAGTAAGITAIQMDIKLKGISYDVMEKALHQAKLTRLEILDIMRRTIASSRPELSHYAPRIFKITIPHDKIGAVIGPGGRTIRSIISETKATIDIEDDGTVLIGSPSEETAQKVIGIIEGLTKEVQVGETYTGKVSRIMPFGAMVEILPSKEGLVHVSELADYRVNKVEDVVKIGDEIMVKVIEIDRMGRVNLSRRAVFTELSQGGGAKERDSSAASPPPIGHRPPPGRPHTEERRPPYRPRGERPAR